MSMQQLRQLFALESQETLNQMEDVILQLEKDPTNTDAIKRLFRTAHTIKGSAGVVGLDAISAFTHTMEHVLERVRSGELPADEALIKLMLSCHDHISTMLEDAVDNLEHPTEALLETSEALTQQLQVYLDVKSGGAAPAPAKPVPVAPAPMPAPPEETPPDEPASAEAAEAAGLTEASESVPEISGLQQLRARFLCDSETVIQNMLALLPRTEQAATAESASAELCDACNKLVNSAAVVEFMAVSEFAQMLCNVLTQFAAGKLPPETNFIKLLESSCHHLTDLINQTAERGSDLEDEVVQNSQNLLTQLRNYLQTAAQRDKILKSGMPIQQSTPVTVEGDDTAAVDYWHISLRFTEDALRNGIEPLASLRYLNSNGEIISLYTLFDTMPTAEDMDPEACYLGFEIDYKTDADKKTVEEMFELVQEHCLIRILPPHSSINHYIELIQELPEDTFRLGEILIKIGTLTERELEAGLVHQETKSGGGAEVRRVEAPKLGEILVGSGVVDQDVVDAALDKQRQSQEATKSRIQKTLNVDAEKLDQLINLVGELVIANASVNLLMQEVSHDRLKEASSLMSRLVEDIRNSTLRMRMVHIGGTFNRFRRLVHDLSRDLGKQIDLVISGSEAELDKSMVEKINDPLMHLIRNAIDHGIEEPKARVAKGKSPTGLLTLNAYHDSGSIVIEVSDDGDGLNRQKIYASAMEKGLIKPDHDITEAELDSLIFEPSLSTAGTVTQLSGRGVGLDVVKRNISALNGMVDVISEEGQGTTFQIILPLTLAIIDGFLLSVGESSFVVPLDRVVECVEFAEQEQQITQTGYLNLRGKVLPLVRLHDLFGIPKTPSTRENIIVVRYGSQEAGLVVDALLGEFQAVIKPLGKIFEKLAGVSGATILGNGEVALILDVPGLVHKYAGSATFGERRRVASELDRSGKL